MRDCCTSDFSRQRALIVTNSVDVMVRGILRAIEHLEPGAPVDLKRVLVQLDQLVQRSSVEPSACDSVTHVLHDARAYVASGDNASAIETVRDVVPTLGRLLASVHAHASRSPHEETGELSGSPVEDSWLRR